MESTEVMAVLKSDNKLKIGYDTTGHPVLGLDTFVQDINGTSKTFSYVDEITGKKAMLLIDGQKTFNKNHKHQLHNWNTLQIDIKLHPDLAEQVTLIDPQQDSINELKKAKRLKGLMDVILAHEQDPDWLAKVHRRVVGNAGGLTTSVLLRVLLDKALTDLDKFGQTDWLFEDDNFETEALLDLATERGYLIRDGEFYKYQNKDIFAESRAKAVYKLNNDPAYKNQLQNSVSATVKDVTPDTSFKIEDTSLLELIDQIGEDQPMIATNADGSVDESADGDARQIDLENLVQTLVEANMIQETDGQLSSIEFNLAASSRAELLGQLKVQPELEKMFREFAA